MRLPFISDEGSCVVSSLINNTHISEVVLTLSSDMEVSSDNNLTELDYHSNMVILGKKTPLSLNQIE